jgi:hypothetical protein
MGEPDRIATAENGSVGRLRGELVIEVELLTAPLVVSAEGSVVRVVWATETVTVEL